MALKFAPFGSEIELPFYTALSQFKIDFDKLDDSARPVLGLYEPRVTSTPEESCRMQVLGNALTSDDVPTGYIRAEGKIKNVNTVEDFKNMDKAAMLHTAAKQIWDAINDGTIYSIPSLLSSFTILSFANLKKYTFTYWFAFPALHSEPVWKQVEGAPSNQLSGNETGALADVLGTWRYAHDKREHGFFLVKKTSPSLPSSERPSTPGASGDELNYDWVVGSLREFESGFFDGISQEDRYVAFVDPSTYPENPGWMLRNLLVLIKRRYKLNRVQILCYRDVHSRRHEARSRIIVLETEGQAADTDVMPKVTGWERNSNQRLSPKTTNLAQYMDPSHLADQAVDLNLKLMKWRIAPDLNLNKIKDTKCLLLGAGTLGTYVSRLLMGWGVRKITFIDNATVSFSNPVRQPLFDFKDCIDGGAKKAFRAAEALQEIYPGVDSTGFVMSVPMLGHPITDEQNTRLDFETLEKLMDDHDAIFLLMDTRESRWLPTVMGKAKNKLVLNAALGFDTWVVMRHGVFAADGGPAALGCYFCNDVVAPADSVKDQTLDQQCTVTRPGVAPTASAQLVELMVSALQHPDGARAPAPKISTNQQSTSRISYERDPPNHPLGLIPHQIRGFAATFQNLLISGQSYDCCSACSPKIVDEYKRSGWEFIKRALTEKDYITELSGLAEVQRRAEEAAGDVDWDSEEGGMDDEGEGELL
ncbi:related to APG7 (component of the autophagic system) [Rhynchosporium agropyri]|uniref:Ubiquitin-like modifier-activating enzyme ATG7 n=1 Tax=Rhynchosporium agropyri TaxID=914238 RepID=A0A1E1LPE5_9HELO|nr:related to APG7 (component of the autophagic system) [Rhynchosporium agropyri]